MYNCHRPPYELALPWAAKIAQIEDQLHDRTRIDLRNLHPGAIHLKYPFPGGSSVFGVNVWEVNLGWTCPGCEKRYLFGRDLQVFFFSRFLISR